MDWLLLIYRIPREPTAGRVYVWRKLKQLGAVAVQDAVWVLPANPRTREQFQWLASEIAELGGEATLFVSQSLFTAQQQSLQEQFDAPVRQEYAAILKALKARKRDLAALSKRYQQAQALDYFQCPLGSQVRQKLLSLQGDEK